MRKSSGDAGKNSFFSGCTLSKIPRMKRYLALAALIAIASGCRATRIAQTPIGPHFRILTYNVNWGGPAPDVAAKIIRESGAEIVCLQETTPDWERFLRSALPRDYSFAQFRNSKNRMGGGLAFI